MINRKQKSPPKPIPIGVWMALILIFILELFGYTWCRVQNVRIGYEISAARKERQELIILEDNLNMRLARLKSPQRLAEFAQKRGLVTPTQEQKLTLP
jgi:cell division protein FtsL